MLSFVKDFHHKEIALKAKKTSTLVHKYVKTLDDRLQQIVRILSIKSAHVKESFHLTQMELSSIHSLNHSVQLTVWQMFFIDKAILVGVGVPSNRNNFSLTIEIFPLDCINFIRLHNLVGSICDK